MDAAAPSDEPLQPAAPMSLRRHHVQRLRALWRSAGWPCRDVVEAELIAAGLLQEREAPHGHIRVVLTALGVQAIAQGAAVNRSAFDAHETLCRRVALAMHRDGRLVWRGLMLRSPLTAVPALAPVGNAMGHLFDAAPPAKAPPRARWVRAMPDVYSIRSTSREDRLEPIAHEIKVRRADLLSDLRRPDKGAAYRAVASQCWYVLAEGIGEPDEIAPEYGVAIARGDELVVARAAPRRSMRAGFDLWMALARSAPQRFDDEDPQAGLPDLDAQDASSD